MRLLLDTHSFLWFINGDKRLSTTAQEIISDIDNGVLLSVASVWEIAIKVSLGKLLFEEPFENLIPEQLAENSIDLLPIHLDDLSLVAQLPFHHRDPFDRLIIAQSITNKIPIVGKDPAFNSYAITRIW